MGERTNVSVRALLRNEDGHLVLIRRVRTGRDPYWVTPGGGVETDDASLEDALRRELHEELGAEVELGGIVGTWTHDGVTTHCFSATLVSLDESLRHGPEVDDPSRGRYEIAAVPYTYEALAAITLVPRELVALLMR
jgi:8-oxo-dGTP pyrophosphatase MutT (NUDIX family)